MGRKVRIVKLIYNCIDYITTSLYGEIEIFLNYCILRPRICHFIVIMVSGFPPEKDFLEKIKAIDGVSQVETQTITNMEI